MENKRIMIENLVNRQVGITIRELNLSRSWEKKGAKKPIELDVLKQAIYDPGVEGMFVNGLLGIAEPNAKEILVELGLESEDSEEPENIIVLNDKQRRRLMTVAPMEEFKNTLKKLGLEQINQLADYAIENKLADFDKCELIKQACGIDINKAITLKRANEEA